MQTKNGRASLLVAGAGEIIIGVASFFLIRSLLATNEGAMLHSVSVVAGALANLALLYALCGFKVVAGLVAILFASKPQKHLVLTVLGFLLCLFAIASVSSDGSALSWVMNSLTLLFPSIYIYGALQHRRAAQ